jgi:membrane protease YdiL (CAAX protease family)
MLELATLLSLAAGVLLLFPQRPTWVNLLLAGLGLLLLLANGRYTRQVVWARHPAEGDRRQRDLRCTVAAGAFTLLGALALAALSLGLDGGARLRQPQAPAVLPLYFAWALLQQYLFQFYLLGRLLVVLPVAPAITLTGLAFASAHLPHLALAAATLVPGLVWTALYYRYRSLLPLAVSHAVLGSCLFHWIIGRDLLSHWRALSAPASTCQSTVEACLH